jgi:hypothetical protein
MRLLSTVGAHRHYLHPDGRRVTVTFHHPGQNFAPKTLRSMIELQARWSEADLYRLKLTRSRLYRTRQHSREAA